MWSKTINNNKNINQNNKEIKELIKSDILKRKLILSTKKFLNINESFQKTNKKLEHKYTILKIKKPKTEDPEKIAEIKEVEDIPELKKIKEVEDIQELKEIKEVEDIQELKEIKEEEDIQELKESKEEEDIQELKEIKEEEEEEEEEEESEINNLDDKKEEDKIILNILNFIENENKLTNISYIIELDVILEKIFKIKNFGLNYSKTIYLLFIIYILSFLNCNKKFENIINDKDEGEPINSLMFYFIDSFIKNLNKNIKKFLEMLYDYSLIEQKIRIMFYNNLLSYIEKYKNNKRFNESKYSFKKFIIYIENLTDPITEEVINTPSNLDLNEKNIVEKLKNIKY